MDSRWMGVIVLAGWRVLEGWWRQLIGAKLHPGFAWWWGMGCRSWDGVYLMATVCGCCWFCGLVLLVVLYLSKYWIIIRYCMEKSLYWVRLSGCLVSTLSRSILYCHTIIRQQCIVELIIIMITYSTTLICSIVLLVYNWIVQDALQRVLQSALNQSQKFNGLVVYPHTSRPSMHISVRNVVSPDCIWNITALDHIRREDVQSLTVVQ